MALQEEYVMEFSLWDYVQPEDNEVNIAVRVGLATEDDAGYTSLSDIGRIFNASYDHPSLPIEVVDAIRILRTRKANIEGLGRYNSNLEPGVVVVVTPQAVVVNTEDVMRMVMDKDWEFIGVEFIGVEYLRVGEQHPALTIMEDLRQEKERRRAEQTSVLSSVVG
jgi:hypothetical protein